MRKNLSESILQNIIQESDDFETFCDENHELIDNAYNEVMSNAKNIPIEEFIARDEPVDFQEWEMIARDLYDDSNINESILTKLDKTKKLHESENETEKSLRLEIEKEIEFCEEKLKDKSLKGQERVDTENDLKYAKKRLSNLQNSKVVDNIKIASSEEEAVNRVLSLIDDSYKAHCVSGECSYRAFKNYWLGIIDRMTKYLDSDKLKRFDK